MNSKMIKILSTVFLILTAVIIAYIIYNIFISGLVNSNKNINTQTAEVNIKTDSRSTEKVDPEKNPYYKEKLLKENAEKKNNPEETFLDLQDRQYELKNIDAEVINLYSNEDSSSRKEENSSEEKEEEIEEDITPDTVVSNSEIILESAEKTEVKPENNLTIQLMLQLDERENISPAVTVVNRDIETSKKNSGSSEQTEVNGNNIYVKSEDGSEVVVSNSSNTMSSSLTTSKNSSRAKKDSIYIQPGYSTIAKLRTAIDNSGKIPALADIVTGRFEGCVLTGRGEANIRNDALYITFNRLSCSNGEEYKVKAVAFSLANQSAEFADRVDRHVIDRMFIGLVRSGLKLATSAFLYNKSREQKVETSETDSSGRPRTVNVYNSTNLDPSLFKEVVQPLDSELQNISNSLKTEIMVDRRYLLVMFY